MNDIYAEDRFDSLTAQKMAYNAKIIQTFEKIKSSANSGYYECMFLSMPDYVKSILIDKGYIVNEQTNIDDFNQEYKIFIVSWKI